MKLRQPTDGDMEWLVKEWSCRNNVERIHAFSHRNISEVKNSAEYFFSRPEQVIVAELDSEVIGLAQLDIDPFKKLSHNAFFCLLVSKEHRNKGVGTAIMKELIEIARSKFNVKTLFLDVSEGNPAIRLYDRLGFMQCGCEPRFLKSGLSFVNKIIMYMEL